MMKVAVARIGNACGKSGGLRSTGLAGIVSLTLGTTACFFWGFPGGWLFSVVLGDEQPTPAVQKPTAPFSRDYDTVERRALERLRSRDLRRITLRQAGLFHRRFAKICERELPEDVDFRYHGPLALENGRQRGQRILNQGLESSTEWVVQKSVIIFSLWISTKRSNQSVSACQIDRVEFFVNVDFVDENRSVDEKLPELGGRSVREFLSLLAQKPKK